MSRPVVLTLVALAALLFLTASVGLARVLSAASAERDAAVDAVRAGANDTFEVLNVRQPSRIALAARTATVRVAWRVAGRLPVVQCVRVRRTGDLLGGFDVTALRVGAPIDREASCP